MNQRTCAACDCELDQQSIKVNSAAKPWKSAARKAPLHLANPMLQRQPRPRPRRDLRDRSLRRAVARKAGHHPG